MKQRSLLLLAITLFCLISSCILVLILPETVPCGFILDGTIEQFGNKYEYLLFPFSVLMIGVIGWASQFFFAKEKPKLLKRIQIIVIMMNSLLTAYTFSTLLYIAIIELSGI